MAEMSTPSPGPGWWLASDGKWYPQQWEYKSILTVGADPVAALTEMGKHVETLGQQGWEMVNFTVQPHQTVSTSYKFATNGVAVAKSEPRGCSVAWVMKRPIAP
jgi:hypothetical protein